MLGHEHLNTTQIYTQVSIEKLKEVHARTHPARLHRETNTEEPKEASIENQPPVQ
jgi:integrase/recombinase XerD